jgi:hypothetical protein
VFSRAEVTTLAHVLHQGSYLAAIANAYEAQCVFMLGVLQSHHDMSNIAE